MTTTPAVSNQFSLFQKSSSPSKHLRVSVIIPVRNEAYHLTKSLEALATQVDLAGNPLDYNIYEVLLLANNCTDDSAAIAHQFKTKFPSFNLHIEEVVLSAAKSNIGYVRRILMDEAYNRLQIAQSDNGIIASTDGDTTVDCQWISQIIAEIDKGCDAVGGRILTKAKNSPERRYYLRDVMYRTLLAKAEALLNPMAHDLWPKHFQYFGASLAVSCSAYLKAGRLPAVTHLEDNAFHEALLLVDAKVRKSNTVRAYTSTRLQGKVEIGLSEQLRKWNDMAEREIAQLVESTATSLSRYKIRALIRQCRDAFLQNTLTEKDLEAIAQSLSLCPRWLLHELRTKPYLGQLRHRVELQREKSNLAAQEKLIPISQAIAELSLFIHKHS